MEQIIQQPILRCMRESLDSCDAFCLNLLLLRERALGPSYSSSFADGRIQVQFVCQLFPPFAVSKGRVFPLCGSTFHFGRVAIIGSMGLREEDYIMSSFVLSPGAPHLSSTVRRVLKERSESYCGHQGIPGGAPSVELFVFVLTRSWRNNPK